jgi:hypothetical protein
MVAAGKRASFEERQGTTVGERRAHQDTGECRGCTRPTVTDTNNLTLLPATCFCSRQRTCECDGWLNDGHLRRRAGSAPN